MRTTPASLGALLAVLSAGSLATAAEAAPRQARFTAFLEGRQETTWTMDRHQTGGDCKGTTYRSGSGTETVRFRSKPIKVLAYQANKRAGLQVRYGTWDPFSQRSKVDIPATGRINRTGAFKDTLDPGECGPPKPAAVKPADCGTRDWRPRTQFRWRGNRVEVDAFSGRAGGVFYVNCPIYSADGVDDADFTDGISQRYPVREVFDRSQGLVEVLGRKRWQQDLPYANARTSSTLRWKLRLRRAK